MLNGIAPYSPYPLSALQAPQAAAPRNSGCPQLRQAAVGYLLARRLRPDFPH